MCLTGQNAMNGETLTNINITTTANVNTKQLTLFQSHDPEWRQRLNDWYAILRTERYANPALRIASQKYIIINEASVIVKT